MKKIVAITLLVTALAFAGCKKDNNNNNNSPYVGTWLWDAITLQLNSNNTYTIVNQGAPSGNGKYTATATQLSFTDSSGVCPLSEVGIYSFTVVTTTSGGGYYSTGTSITTLTLKLVSDSCSFRASNLPGPYTQ